MLTSPSSLLTTPSSSEVYFSHRDGLKLRNCQTRRAPKNPSNTRDPGSLSCKAGPFRQQGSRASGSGVQDAQETELAAADQQAKQDLYAQLFDRQQRGTSSEVSTSNAVDNSQSKARKADTGSTELIFRLERRGEGWGEEIFPHLVVEQRPWASVAKRDRNRSSRPKPWTANTLLTPSLLKHSPPAAGRHARKVCMAALSSSSPEPVMHAQKQEGSAEQFLLNECGIEECKVDEVIRAAVAWRVTPGGRQLIDRRRRSRIERNLLICAEYLVKECGIEPGSKGVGQIFTKVPQIMLCKPSTNDRWDRRVVELAAFMHRHGHCNVPEGWTEAPDLAKWVRRQRVARAQSALTEERLQVLYAMGFEFGDVAQLTEEWESKFDQLIEWLLWQDQDFVRKEKFDWLGFDWGRRGGLQARELALWVQLQREFRRRNLLDTDAIKRLETIGFKWEPEKQGKLWQHQWMHQLGRLLYIVERNRKISAAVDGQPAGRPQPNQPTAPPTVLPPQSVASRAASQGLPDPSIDIVSQRPVLRASAQSASRGFPPPFPSRYSPQGSRVGPQGAQKPVISKGANALQRQIAKRRAALASAHLEAGQGFWLAKQRWLWRRGRLPREQFLMLQLAGLEMDIDPPLHWKRLAHEAAHYLNGSQIQPDQDVMDDGTAQQQTQAAAPGSQLAPASSSRGTRRLRKVTSQAELKQPQSAPPEYRPQQIPVSAQFAKWQTELAPAHMYVMAHSSGISPATSSSMVVQQPQLRFQPSFARPPTASTRPSSTANGAASSASLDDASSCGSKEQSVSPNAEASAKTESVADAATTGSDSCRGGSLYACTPPGRPPGRRCAMVRWVLSQRALWREGQLTPIQMQYMTILGVTWLLSSQVVRMSESVWLEQLEAYSQHVASPGQQIAAEHIRMTNWLLHQQGLHALGFLQPQRVQKLKQLNVPWQPIRTEADILWDAKLTQLMSFRREHGHVRVPSGYLKEPSLYLWISLQYKLLRKGVLPSGRAAQLLALGVKPDDAISS